ncbi:MAG: GNAT family N-acetyltransferase [Bdellovibrionaceae bacterium]|nr:GNAT family N-acetyltransferase [Pseudobdellovibrionaceae bacterium]|tara:strand:+ start:24164 stop:24619 length:456 start_codon:yes stop_codon:yes gene_type:complete
MEIRKAKNTDLDAIIELLHDDTLGKDRESVSDGDMEKYRAVFIELSESEYFDVFVMVDNKQIIGCYQMMYLPHLSFTGTQRGQVESVRIRSDLRGKGLGTKLMKHAIDTARKAGCGIFQLTSNKERKEANKFYRELGLEPTHDGYKLYYSS